MRHSTAYMTLVWPTILIFASSYLKLWNFFEKVRKMFFYSKFHCITIESISYKFSIELKYEIFVVGNFFQFNIFVEIFFIVLIQCHGQDARSCHDCKRTTYRMYYSVRRPIFESGRVSLSDRGHCTALYHVTFHSKYSSDVIR